jgi:CheY-like chemotaxis protein
MTDVLIVDDDLHIGEMVQQVLHNEGFSSTYCDHPLAAIQHLSREPYRILITDMKMPQISGLELLIWANYHYPHLQSLMLTAYPSETIENLALAGGAQIITKPFEYGAFVRQVRLCMTPGIASSIKQIQLSDLLQILALEQSGIALEIEDTQRQATAYIGIERQMLTYAEWISPSEHLSGWEACAKVLSIKRGSFKERNLREFTSNLNHPVQDTLMIMADQQDASHQSLSTQFQGKRHFSSIAYISEQPQALQVLLKILENQNFDLQSSCLSALNQISNEASILFHLTAPTQLDELKQFCQEHPHTPIILLNHLPSPAHLSAPNIVKQFEYPWKLQEIRDYLATHHQQGLSGHFQHLGLLSQIQMFLMTQKPKRISVKNLGHKVSGTIYMSCGWFIEAELGSLRGEEAFYKLMRTTSGTVIELDWQNPPSRSLESVRPFTLLMNASRNFASLSDMQSEIIAKISNSIVTTATKVIQS